MLVLLPESKKSLEAKWQGPFRIMRRVSDPNYEVDVGGSRKSLRTYHVNLLRKWKSRQETVMWWVNSSQGGQKVDWKLLRWSLTLQEYDFQVIHKAGSCNRNADALSRI